MIPVKRVEVGLSALVDAPITLARCPGKCDESRHAVNRLGPRGSWCDYCERLFNRPGSVLVDDRPDQ